MRPWITFFSQTGNEIYNLSNAMGRYPDAIVTNKKDLDSVNPDLVSLSKFRSQKLNRNIWFTLPDRPSLNEYKKILSKFKKPLITLHGFLRIIPEKICNSYEIYNLHPGLITRFPELKGFNPQEKAFKAGHEDAGCVIHRVTPGVDEGEIVASGEITIKDYSLAEVYKALHDCAFDTWINFFTEHKIYQSES